MIISKKLFLLPLYFTFLYASPTNTRVSESSFYDTWHEDISHTVLDWSKIADMTISQWLGDNENNITCASPQIAKPSSKSVDVFFQNNKYLNETEDTFIRVRMDSTFESRESNSFNIKLSAQIPFSKCRQKLKLFVEDISLNNQAGLNKEFDNSDIDLGIRYYGNTFLKNIESRYSLGIHGINPYISVKYRYPVNIGYWSIDTIQNFEYSIQDDFKEESNIYFDRAFENNTLFRFNLQRGTSSGVNGMDYGFTFQYYFNTKKNSGLRLSQSFLGNTKYKKTIDTDSRVFSHDTYGGINNYLTFVSYRANIWRKWFYYEVAPSVSFHRDHDYKPNYAIRFFLDFYFGRYN